QRVQCLHEILSSLPCHLPCAYSPTPFSSLCGGSKERRSTSHARERVRTHRANCGRTAGRNILARPGRVVAGPNCLALAKGAKVRCLPHFAPLPDGSTVFG